MRRRPRTILLQDLGLLAKPRDIHESMPVTGGMARLTNERRVCATKDNIGWCKGRKKRGRATA
jgi:hypothetical protein